MKILIIGNGRMGKEITLLATKSAYEIVYCIDSEDDWHNYDLCGKHADVAIEFSVPEAVKTNIMNCFKRNLPVVCGTTGWSQHLAELTAKCIESNQAIIYSSNFSIGMNIVFEINRKLAAIMNNFPVYNVRIDETHHKHKLDSPSGTAIQLAEDIITNIKQKTGWVNNTPDEKSVLINSFREGEITGKHEIVYDSESDTIVLSHSAKNRKGFALGAITAANWIIGRKGVFTMTDLFG